jgi:Uma2 family endonuclease
MSSAPLSNSSTSDFAWEVATLFPEQGAWSEAAYLELTDGSNKRIEFNDGRLEFQAMPTEIHQALVGYLYQALLTFVAARGLGVVPFPPLRVRVKPGKIREPDILFLSNENLRHRSNRLWTGADLVMEVVSADPKDRQRDYNEKLVDYAEGGISEYWIVDPVEQAVIVYQLDVTSYVERGRFSLGEIATSRRLDGFAVNVTALFDVTKDIPQ